MRKVLRNGVRHILKEGLAWDSDLEKLEAHGTMPGADPDLITDRAYERGKKRCGSLGAGNHFFEFQIVDEIFDDEAATAYGLNKGELVLMIHTGSRGLGHQTCDDTLKIMRHAAEKYKYDLPDRQLACAPIDSPEGKDYVAAMSCAANFAWANRSVLTYYARNAFKKVLGESSESLGMEIVYDVSHNIAKWEDHQVDGKKKKLLVHRKGATRAFPPGHPEISEKYRHIGQPVLIPGDMGSESWVLRASENAMIETFGSCCHGAGRAMGRNQARKSIDFHELLNRLESRGIMVRAGSKKGLVEDAPEAYKNVDDVIEVTHNAGISTRVARLKPIAVIKG
jgi:tRNA-splicing ligase RtcB